MRLVDGKGDKNKINKCIRNESSSSFVCVFGAMIRLCSMRNRPIYIKKIQIQNLWSKIVAMMAHQVDSCENVWVCDCVRVCVTLLQSNLNYEKLVVKITNENTCWSHLRLRAIFNILNAHWMLFWSCVYSVRLRICPSCCAKIANTDDTSLRCAAR